jgi:hypothetical protein
MELISNKHLSSISCLKCRYADGKYLHFMTANNPLRQHVLPHVQYGMACLLISGAMGSCYRHNLAESEAGLRTRWTQNMNMINLRIGSCAGVWRAKSAIYLV